MRIARAQAEIQRNKVRDRATETSQKIISGALVIAQALENPNVRRYLISLLKSVSRPADVKRIQPLLAKLVALENAAQESQVMPPRPASS